MHASNRFGRVTPTYICGICTRRTRETGEGESGCQLCADCFYIAGMDNQHNDGGTKPDASDVAELQRRLKNIASKGGDVDAVKKQNEFCFPKA